MSLITVNSTAKNTLTRTLANAAFQKFVSGVLADCAISFDLRGNAFEGYEFNATDSKIVDTTEIIAELVDAANKL